MDRTQSVLDIAEALELLQQGLARERESREAAERLLEAKSKALMDSVTESRQAERRLQMALWASGEGIWEWDVPGDRVTIDRVLPDGSMRRVGPMTLAAMMRRVDPLDRDTLRLVLRMYLSKAAADIDTAYRTSVGPVTRWQRIRGRALLRTAEGAPVKVIGTIKDVTDQRTAEQSLHLMAQAFASTHDALVVVDPDDHVIQANEPFAALVQMARTELEGRCLSAALGLVDPLHQRSAPRGEVDLMLGGEVAHVEYRVTPVQSGAERSPPPCFIVTLRDVSERRRAADALHRQADLDGLTGLCNRVSVMRQLDARCNRADAPPFSLLFLDLDGFKEINDTLGHRAGDALLVETARMLQALATGSTVGRLGGDEFVIVMASSTGVAAAESLASAIQAQAARPVVIDGTSVAVTPSIGIACFPEDGRTPEDLLLDADIAMYAAKEQGRGRCVVYHGNLDRDRQRRQQLQQLLRADSDRDAFSFVVQSQLDGGMQLVGGEMLIRWRTAAFGAVSPAEFIPLAEQIGVIDRIGRQALRTAAQAAAILAFKGSAVTVAVNLSPRQLLMDDVERMLVDACDTAEVQPSRIVLELTETALVSDADKVGALLKRLEKRGFGLALDDFGTGYSSLSHLRQLPFHKVKIDRSFVQDLDTDPRAEVMMQGIVRLCTSLGLAIVAEGIETRAQFDRLRQMGVEHYQGYWLSRPKPLAAWIAEVSSAQRRLPAAAS